MRTSGWRLSLALALFITACTRPATQLVPVIDSDVTGIACVLVEVGVWREGVPFNATSSSRFPIGASGVRLPFSLGVTPPQGDHAARLELRTHALASCESEARSITRVTRSGFIRDQSLQLPIFLSQRCMGVVCGENETCDEGSCTPVVYIEPSVLQEVAPGEEFRDAGMRDTGTESDVGTDAGAPRIPATVMPTWALGSNLQGSFDSTSAIDWDEASGDVFLSARVEPTAFAVGTETFAGPGLVLARVARDGAVRWAKQWTIPAGGLYLQRIGVSDFATANGALFACGSVGEPTRAPLTTEGRTWASTPRGDPRFDRVDAWVARLDPNTGALLAVSVASLPAGSTDGDVSCAGLMPLPSGDLGVIFQFYNSVTPASPAGIVFDGAAVSVLGTVPPRARTAIVRLAVGATSFNAIDARLGASDKLTVLDRPGGGALLLMYAIGAPAGFVAGEPAVDPAARYSAAVVGLDENGVPDFYTRVAQTSDQFQHLRGVTSDGALWIQAAFTEALTDGIAWGEFTGGTRVDRAPEFIGSVEIVGRFDPATGARVEQLPGVNPFGKAVLAASDREGNLYLYGGLGMGDTAPGIAAGFRPNGVSDAYLASLTPTGALRWQRTLTEDTAEPTYGDRLTDLIVASDGSILVGGQSSTSGIAFTPSTRVGGSWFGFYSPVR